MKSEERHQLLTNDLGVVTTKTVGFFERHAGSLIAGVCAVLLLSGFVYWQMTTTEAGSTVGWTSLDTAETLEELGGVADKFKGQPPGQWAQLQIAEKTLQNAMPLMFTNREIALTDIKRCREGFESLLHEKSILPAIRERSLWGLALCLETACDGDTSKPIEAFERLNADFPNNIFKPVAEERIAALKKSDAKEFYSWFSKEKPQPPEVSPRDFKLDSVKLPAPTWPDEGSDDDPEGFGPQSPDRIQIPQQKNEPAPAAPEKADDTTKPTVKPETDKPEQTSIPVEGGKPVGADPPKDVEKPKDKN